MELHLFTSHHACSEKTPLKHLASLLCFDKKYCTLCQMAKRIKWLTGKHLEHN